MAEPAERTTDGALSTLPTVFSYGEARAAGLSNRRLYELRDADAIEQLGRGLFRQPGSAEDSDPDLLEIAHRAPRATLCLTTALARHDLSDAIPARIDVALPRGQRHPRIQAPATWHSFALRTFDIGRDELSLGETSTIGLYSPERCIIDAFRLRHQEGPETAVEALRRWLRRRGSSPATLATMARSFPKAEPALRATMDILL